MPIVDRTATLIASPEAPVLFILRSDAKRLHAVGKLQKIEGRAAYCAPRTWRQIARDQWSSLPREALDLSAFRPIDLSRFSNTK